eukprot:5883591-Pleurochrysis_carterae.AAC.1
MSADGAKGCNADVVAVRAQDVDDDDDGGGSGAGGGATGDEAGRFAWLRKASPASGPPASRAFAASKSFASPISSWRRSFFSFDNIR